MTNSHYQFAVHSSDSSRPALLFLFHGTGGDENQFFTFGRQLLPDATLISPRGDVSEHGALRFFKRTGEGQYDMADLALRTTAMVEFIKEQIGLVQPSVVLGLGYSNGANILTNVMLEEPDLFHGAVLMHPLIPCQPKPQPLLKQKRVLLTAGRRDTICPPSLTQQLADYFNSQAAETTLFWHEGGHEIQQAELSVIQSFLDIYKQ